MSISLETRRLRAALLCCHCLRNIAYYRAWWEKGKPHAARNFWVGANGNFIEIAVLEWCKLFGDRKGKYVYSKLVPNDVEFLTTMLAEINETQDDWNQYVTAMKTYRDKYIAHWDDEIAGAHRPGMDTAIKSTVFLLNTLGEIAESPEWPAPKNGASFYDERKADALNACAAKY